MASPRKSAQQVAAREKARQKAADFTASNEDLIELAARLIEFHEAAQGMETAAQEKTEGIIAQGKADAEEARNESGDDVARMLETGESRSAVAARLGMSVATLKKYVPAPAPATPAVVPADA
ncbi:MAG: helix-turn-helix domain-containing protein [Micrococcaceae bacterium]|nr:helix-turn-helix domain-containing protein [Micrococcaceae bacterium]